MRYSIILITLILLLSSQGIAQKPQYVRISRDKVLVSVASQPDCPLRIQSGDFLLRADQPGILIKYRAKNVSKKSISSFHVVALEHSGTGGTLPVLPLKRKLTPGEVLESTREGADYRLIPITDSLREKLKPENEMQALYILMVEKVFFADGTVYEDEGALKALMAFLVASEK